MMSDIVQYTFLPTALCASTSSGDSLRDHRYYETPCFHASFELLTDFLELIVTSLGEQMFRDPELLHIVHLAPRKPLD